ncbi:zinc finger CCCH domain-containing protein 13 isoform X1, partial [Silurus meridionalis]
RAIEGRRDLEQDQRQRERFAQLKGRLEEIDLRVKDRRREKARYTNGRTTFIEHHEEDREREKGDTFPRTMRPSNEREGRTRHSLDQSYELIERGKIGSSREIDMIEIERERERERAKKKDKDTQRYREMERQRENERRILREEMKRNAERQLEKEDLDRLRWDPSKRGRREERYRDVSESDQQVLRRREKDQARNRPRDREDRYYSPQTRRIKVGERENFSDRDERDERRKAVQKERHRYTKSDGETNAEKNREVPKQEDAVAVRLDARSEVDKEKDRTRDKLRERERRREVEKQRERDRRKEKETVLRSNRGELNEESVMKRYREREIRERGSGTDDRRPDGQRDRLKGNEDRRREKELNERMWREHDRERTRIPPAEREKDVYVERADRQRQNCYEEEVTGRIRQTQRETDRKEAPSMRERIPGSDVEADHWRRKKIDYFEEKERKHASAGDREKKRSEEGTDAAWGLRKEEVREGTEKEETEMEREKEQEISEGKKRQHRKMWLEPRQKKEEEFKEREQARERYAQRYKEHKTSRGEEEISTESKNGGETILLDSKDVDNENLDERIVSDETVFDNEPCIDILQTEAENMDEILEESDREEEQGSDRYVNSEGEEENEGVWEDLRDKVTSGDDGFVTVSSGAEEEDESYEDCTEFWDDSDREGLARQLPRRPHLREQGIEAKMTKERSDHTVTVFCVVGQTLPRSGSIQNPLLDHMEQEETSQNSFLEMGGVAGDQDEAPSRDTEAKGTSADLSLPEEDMSISYETKSDNAESDQMAKEVIPSEDLVISGDVIAEKDTEPYPAESIETLTKIEDHWNTQVKMTDGENQVEGQNEMESSCHLEVTENTENSKRFSAAPHVKWAKNVLSEILGSTEDGTNIVSQPSTPYEQVENVLLQVEAQSEGEEELDHLSVSPDLHSLSSDNETDKEGNSKKEKKQKKKPRWKILGSSSFRDLGHEVWGRRPGIRRTVQKTNQEEEEGEGVGRDRRTRIFTTVLFVDTVFKLTHSVDSLNLKTMSIKETLSRSKMRKSKYYNSQLYQQYSEVVQNRELIHQSHSDASSVFGDAQAFSGSSSPSHSPTFARRPLPPLPPVPHPYSVSHTNSVSSGSVSLAIPHDTNQRPPSPRLSRSLTTSPMLWQDLPGVINNPELKNLSKDERRLQEVPFEVVTSESSYCSSLEIVVEHFVKCKQLNILLTSQDKNWLFSKLSDVRTISHSFFSQLEERVESDIMHFTVCDIIIKHCAQFRAVYVPYLTNQSYQDKTYQRLMNENAGFRHIVEKLEQSPKCQRLPFRSFLILPFQRITRLKLLVQNIVKRTDPKTPDEAQAIKAMKLLEKMIQDSNDSISQMNNIESLVSLNAKVDFECRTLPLISQSRRLVKEGQLTELRDLMLKEKERTAYIHLFNDYLLLSLPKEGGRFTVIDHAPVSELKAENCRIKLHSLQKNIFRLHMGQKALLLRAETQADKLRWISALSQPHPEIDLTAAKDIPQMQCIKAFIAQQPDELSLEKADVLLVQQSTDGWVEGTRLSDRLRGWVPESHLETIVSAKARERNLIDTLKITTATATV